MSAEDGDYIIEQGDKGDAFYLIVSGRVKCTKSASGESKEGETLLMELGEGSYFGEVALLLNEPRQANVVAVGSVRLLSLNRKQFDSLLGSLRDVMDLQMHVRILKSVPLLKDLTDRNLEVIANALISERYEVGSSIIRQGEEGDSFYIIKDGVAKVTRSNKEGEPAVELAKLKTNNYFGEMALMKKDVRNANVIAVTRVECMVLQRDQFQKLLGPLEDVLRDEMANREALIGKVKGLHLRSSSLDMSIEFDDLKQLATLGTGTFGRVKLVQYRKTGKVMALKAMQKAHIIKSHQQKNVMNEKNIMAECQHPLILQLIRTFQDAGRIYMLLEIVQGGELWSLLYEKKKLVGTTRFGGFPPSACLFYAGCVTSALQYMHKKDIAYRDLKPENLLIDNEGYLKVCISTIDLFKHKSFCLFILTFLFRYG